MTLAELEKLSYNHPIVFFDGQCNLCNSFVQFVIARDKKEIFKFCQLQNETSKLIEKKIDLGTSLETTVGLKNGLYATHSDVLHMVAKTFGGFWSLLTPFYWLPKSFRDLIYSWVARNRYKLFGKQESCMIPDPSLESRFL